MAEEWIKKLLLPVSIALTAGVARTILDGERRTFGEFFRGLFLAGFVGALVALALSNTSFSETYKGFIIGVASFAGEDLLLGVLKVSRAFTENPHRYLRRYLNRK